MQIKTNLLKYKKVFFVLLVNILIITSLYHFVCSEIKHTWDIKLPFIEQRQIPDDEVDVSMYNVEEKPYDYTELEYTPESRAQFCGEERIEFGVEHKNTKNPILVFGCSYAYGHGLNKSESFSALLSNITNRPVYNFSDCGSDAWRSYSKMKRYLNEYNDELKNIGDAEYVVYIYMHDHIKRYLHPYVMINHYDEMFKPNKIEKFINKSFLLKFINTKLKQANVLDEFPESKKSSIYLKDTLLKWHAEVKKYAPNSKFIIVLWDEKIALQGNASVKYVSDIMLSYIWTELEQETNGNIQVVHTKDLTGILYDKKYRLKADIDDWHPDAKAWNLLVPSFAEKFIN